MSIRLTNISKSTATVAELGYASVLGTDTARFVGSNPTCRTILKNGRHSGLMQQCVCQTEGEKFVCRVVCVFAISVQTVETKVAVVLGYLLNALLRNYRYFFSYSPPHRVGVIPRLFLNNPLIHPRIGFANTRKQTCANTRGCIDI